MTIEIGGNTEPLQQALKDVNREVNSTQKELKEVNKLLKLDPNNVTLLKQKQELLTKAIDDSTTKLDALKKAQKQLDDEVAKGNPINQAEYRKLEREIASTENTLAKLKQEADQTNPKLQALKNGLAKVGEVAGGVAKKGLDLAIKGVEMLTAGAIAGGTALLKMGVDAGKLADDLNTLSATTGLSTEQLQKFKYASDLIDVDMNTLTGALKKTTSAMSSASKGTGKQADAFKKLGVSIKNVDGTLRNNNDVFEDSIRALGKISNETERDALAMELFGKSATELNPLIEGGIDKLGEMGDRAERLGLILSQDALDGANKFNDELDILKANGQGIFNKIGNQVARDLAPHLEKVNEITEGIIERLSGALDKGGIQGAIDEALEMFSEIKWDEVAQNLSDGINGMLTKLNEFLAKIDWKEVGSNIMTFIENINWGELLKNLFMLIGGLIGGAGQVLWGFFDTLKEDIATWWEDKLEKAGGDGGKAFTDALGETIQTTGQTLYDSIVQPLAQGIADALNIDTDIPNFHKLTQELGIWWEELKLWWNLNVFEPIGKFWADIVVKFAGWGFDLMMTLNNLKNNIVDTWNGFWSWLSGIATSIYNWGVERLGDIIKFFADIGLNITNFFTVTIPEKWNNFLKWLTGIFEKIKGIGTNLVKGLWEGINNATGWLGQKIKEWCNQIIEKIQAYLGIESPSKVMANEVGKYMAQGIGVGFNNTLPSVVSAMQDKLSTMTDSFRAEMSLGDIPEIQGHTIVSENNYVTKNYTNTIETIRQPQAVELVLDGTKVARTLIPSLNNEYNRLGVKI